ncbi:MAG: hypothetical protein AAB592_00060, partial [Patescibacteria group bacterium]
GYEKIPALLPSLPIVLPIENRVRILKHNARRILSYQLGFTETMHYSFYDKWTFSKALLPEEPHLTVQNPLSNDQTHMRTSLVPNMLKSLARNIRTIPACSVYELGRQYRKRPGDYFPLEEKYLTGMVTHPGEKEIFYYAKGAADQFMKCFRSLSYYFVENSVNPPPYAHPLKAVDLFVKNGEEKIRVGHVFELHPLVAKNFDIDGTQVGIFEINFSVLASLPLTPLRYASIPRFPGIEIDISVLVDRTARNSDLDHAIRKADDALITDVELIDTFEDNSLGNDKKSLTYRIRLQAPDRTLTDSEMTVVQGKIFQNLNNAGYRIRGAA